MPNPRQIAAAKELANKVGNTRKGKKPETDTETFTRMGYSHSYARSGNIKKKIGFREAFDKAIPPETLVDLHKKLMNSSMICEKTFQDDTSDEEIKSMFADAGIHLWTIKKREIHLGERQKITLNIKVAFFAHPGENALKALDMAYRIRGDIIERHEFDSPGGDMSQTALEERLAELDAKAVGVTMKDLVAKKLDKFTTKSKAKPGKTGGTKKKTRAEPSS